MTSLDRRRLVGGLCSALAGLLVAPVAACRAAAGNVPVDDNAVLIVVDVQNCLQPGGSLAVKEGDQIIPVINPLAKKFGPCRAHPGLATRRATSQFASCASRQEAVRGGQAGLRRSGAVARPLRPGNAGRRHFQGHRDPPRGAHHPQGLPQGRRQLFGVSRSRQEDRHRACRLSQGARPGRGCSSPVSPPTSASHGPRWMPAARASRRS